MECVVQSNINFVSLLPHRLEPWSMEGARLASSRMEAARWVMFLTISFIFHVMGTGSDKYSRPHTQALLSTSLPAGTMTDRKCI